MDKRKVSLDQNMQKEKDIKNKVDQIIKANSNAVRGVANAR